MRRPGNTCCSVLCSRASGTTSSSQAMLCNIHHCVLTSHQTPLFILNHFNFMYQAKKLGAETLFVPHFSPLGPPSHSPCPPCVCSHHNFLLLRGTRAPQVGHPWAFQELFTKSLVTVLVLTGSTWLKTFAHSYCIQRSLTYSH